jgi:DNA phosphorothioation-dependent restriction protein DptH
MSLFYKALGEQLSSSEGLRAAFIPSQLGLDAALAVAEAANSARQAPANEPYALVVSSSQSYLPEGVISPKQTVQYRVGNRLFIFLESAAGLASIEKSMQVLLSDTYPETAASPMDLNSLSKRLLASVLEKNGISAGDSHHHELSDWLFTALKTLADLHKSLSASSGTDWNIQWFRHADQGITRLSTALEFEASNNPGSSLDAFFETSTFASFGLAKPKSRLGFKGKSEGLGKDFDIAISNFWKDEAHVASTLEHLTRKHSGAISYPPAELDWTLFDQSVLANDSTLLAFMEVAVSSVDAVQQLSQLSEEDFFNPLPADVGGDLRITSETDDTARLLPLIGPTNNLHYARNVAHETIGPSSSRSVSEPILIHVPTLQTITTDELKQSTVSLLVKGNSKVSFNGQPEVLDETLVFRGTFEQLVGTFPFKGSAKIHKIELSIQPNDTLFAKIDDRAKTRLLLVPETTTGLLLAELNTQNGVSRFNYLGPQSFDEEDDSFRTEISNPDKNHFVLAWASSANLEGKALAPNENDSGLFATRNIFGTSVEIELDDCVYRLETPSTELEIESPIHAAARKAVLTRGAPTPENTNSLFGKLDSAFSEILMTDCWEDSLLHVILPSKKAISFSDLPLGQCRKGVFSTNSVLDEWATSTNFSVQSTFQESQSVKNFVSAFKALGVRQSLLQRSTSPESPDWISRTSWAHLWGSKRQLLDDYLSAFSKMVAEARTLGDAETLFWASYPFSASVWDTSESGKCSTVIVSPLHPLRLGWLASTEATLKKAPEAELIAGAIEGWNLPAIGPSPTSNGSTIAVPSDSGFGQVFLGWSLMAVASISGFESPSIPMTIAGAEAPGGGASGLNKSSTSSALKDYRRINPHVTTMTIDLAASSPTPRLREIDDSILRSISSWAEQEHQQIPGGVRVWDSLNRGGQAPLAEAAQLATGLNGVPLTWIRYKHENGKTKRCNVRFLQDSGLKVEVNTGTTGGGKNLGVLGDTPLRRFDSSTALQNNKAYSESFPGIGQSESVPPYTEALQVFENTIDFAPSIRSQIFRALLVDDNAEWTVSGESLVSPSGIAKLLSGDAHSQMLWEWRPPLFESTDEFALERRPFISVARIPESFKSQIKELLAKAQGGSVTTSQVDKVLNDLGSRGVGLSSLLSMGGSHASGALGFYLALALLDKVQSDEIDRFILPIDACDSFLRALSGRNVPPELTKRADLLVISLSESAITLTPVEIKFYGLGADGAASTSLPTSTSKALSEAIHQAFETKKLLDLIVARYREVADGVNESTRVLWLNAMGTLTEAAIKLNSNTHPDNERLARRLSKLVEGAIQVDTGKPLVTYFQFNGVSGDGGLQHLEQVSDTNGDWGLLSLDINNAFGIVNGDGVLNDWIALARWCISSPNENSLTEVGGDSPTPAGSDPISEHPVATETSGMPTETAEVPEPESASSSDHAGEDEQAVVAPESGSTDPQEETLAPTFPVNQGVRVVVGSSLNTLAPVEVDFWPGNTELTQMNIGVVGDLGTGKTQFLRSLVSQIRSSAKRTQDTPVNFLVFDYKRDYKDLDFIENVNGRVLSPDKGIPINVLALPAGYSKNRAYKKAMAFCDVLDKIYSNIGPVQKNQLTEVIVTLFENNPGNRAPTLSEVASAYKIANGKPDSVTAILNKFVLPGVFIDDSDQLENFGELLNDRVVVVSLNEFGADSDTKNALVILMLDLYYEYMLTCQKWPFQGSDPQIRKLNSFLLVDEATNIMQYDFPILKSLLLEGREWGFGTILASQYLSHFKTSSNNYGEPLKSWVIHKVPSVKLQELTQIGLSKATDATVNAISGLKVHEALYESLGYQSVKISGLPFYKLVGKQKG